MMSARDNKFVPAILAGGLLFLLLSPQYALANAAIIAGVLLFKRWKFSILILAAMVYLYDVDLTPWPAGPLIRVTACLICVTIVACFLWLKPRIKYPVLSALIFSFIAFTFASDLFLANKLPLLSKVFISYYKMFFWYLVLLMVEPPSTIRSTSLFILPFWGHSMSQLPAATGSNTLMAQEVRDERALTVTLWAAVSILSGTVILKYVTVTLDHLVFAGGWPWLPSLQIPKMISDFGTIVADQAGLPIWQRWVALLTHVFLRYVQLALIFGLIVGQARAVGFMIPAMVNAPWAATSFGDLFSRLLYHYNRLLMKVFYPRFKECLRFVRSGRIRVALSVFLTVFVGGLIFHFPRDTRVTYFNQGVWAALSEYLNAVPYFFVLSAFVSVNLLFRDKRYRPSLAWRLVRPIYYFTLFSLVYSLYMAGVHNRGPWLSYCKYLLSLLNLS